jgi:diguanylate cyclase
MGESNLVTERFDDMDVEYATTVSNRAIQSMSQLSVPATPSNFSVWFHYMLGTSPGLRKTIDVLLSNKRKFDASINHELYTTFVNTNSGALPAGDAPQQLNGIINSAKQLLGDAIADNKTQIAALGEVSARVGANSDPRPIIQTLISELAKANSRATALEMNFVESSNQLEGVRLALAEAEQRSNTDALTGLANRRSLDEFLRASMIRAMETNEPLSTFMIDIDHFKKFNDTHGHLIGDQVLRLVAKVLQDSVREGDLAARFGGEELVAVLPGADLSTCKEVAERVRRRISDAKLTRRTTGQEIGSVTVSIGVAQFRLAESAETLIERCDRGLYQAKSVGRNRVVTETEIEDKVAA